MNYKNHKDNRRTLYEFEYPVTKIIEANEDCELGHHFHKEKDELFMLVAGSGVSVVDGEEKVMSLFSLIPVPQNTPHSFSLKKGSVLVGFCTKTYNPKDDYVTNT